jgi:hypothetical protein
MPTRTAQTTRERCRLALDLWMQSPNRLARFPGRQPGSATQACRPLGRPKGARAFACEPACRTGRLGASAGALPSVTCCSARAIGSAPMPGRPMPRRQPSGLRSSPAACGLPSRPPPALPAGPRREPWRQHQVMGGRDRGRGTAHTSACFPSGRHTRASLPGAAHTPLRPPPGPLGSPHSRRRRHRPRPDRPGALRLRAEHTALRGGVRWHRFETQPWAAPRVRRVPCSDLVAASAAPQCRRRTGPRRWPRPVASGRATGRPRAQARRQRGSPAARHWAPACARPARQGPAAAAQRRAAPGEGAGPLGPRAPHRRRLPAAREAPAGRAAVAPGWAGRRRTAVRPAARRPGR